MPDIHRQILGKQFSCTPSSITDSISNFCAQIIEKSVPLFVSVIPTSEAKASECYFNVKNHIKENGGEIVYGWAIWLWDGVFIEAEHHSIWNSNGQLLDITPPIHKEEKILFLPDNARNYDFETKKRFCNIRAPLNNSLWVKEWIQICNEEFDFLESNRTDFTSLVPKEQYEYYMQHKLKAWINVIAEQHAKKGRNEVCICTSKKKFKKCCGPLIRQ